MRKRSVLAVAALLLVFGVYAGVSQASVVAVGPIVYGDSWSVAFQDPVGAPATFVSVSVIGGASDLEVLTFTGVSNGWQDLRTGLGYPADSAVSSAAMAGPEISSSTTLTWTFNFTGSPQPLELRYVVYDGSSLVTGDDGILGFGGIVPLNASNANNGWWWLAEDGGPSLPDLQLAAQAAPVPEPATIIIWSLLGAGSWLGMRVWRRRGPGLGDDLSGPARQAWSPEARQAIHEIIARGSRERN